MAKTPTNNALSIRFFGFIRKIVTSSHDNKRTQEIGSRQIANRPLLDKTMKVPEMTLSPKTPNKQTARLASRKIVSRLLLGTIALLSITTTGCFGAMGGINIGFLGFPIPVSPYFQHKQEEKFWKKERYDRVPILGPTTSGGPVVALDPPTDDEVMHALETARPVQGGIPILYEKQRNGVRIIKEKIADYVDPPRFIPLIGPAQLHHAHYKCTIYFEERTTIGYPVPHTLHDREAIEVVYIDHNHFHMVGDVEPYTTPNL